LEIEAAACGVAGFAVVFDGRVGQGAGSALSGTILGLGPAPVAKASVTVRNVTTGVSAETQTNAAGAYSLPNDSNQELNSGASRNELEPNVTRDLPALAFRSRSASIMRAYAFAE
jgi:Carboxypeptidase regulatory-like domain